MNNLREASKRNWSLRDDRAACTDEINSGCWQRIADAAERAATATELMGKRYQQLIDERDQYKREYDLERAHSHKLKRQIAGLKSRITRYRNLGNGKKK